MTASRAPLTIGPPRRGLTASTELAEVEPTGHTADRTADSGGRSLLLAASALGTGVYVVTLASALARGSSDVVGGLLVAPVLFAFTLPILKRVRGVQTPWMYSLIVTALVLKMVGSLVRYSVAFQLYDGVADAGRYDAVDRQLARAFRDGNFELGDHSVTSTRFIEVLTGVVYAVAGANKLGGFLIFAWFSFWGLYLFVRAFELAVPDGDHRRYALLMFLLPSLLFWPSSIGKEAWMIFTLGVAAYGAARVLTQARGGYLVLGLGLWGAAQVRPHVALLLIAGLGIGYLLRRAPVSGLGPIIKAFGIAVLVLGVSLVLTRVEQRFRLEDTGSKQIGGVLDYTEKQTTQGGSAFDAPHVRTVADVPLATLTVLFRPFPNEASTTQGVATAAEGMALLGLFVLSIRRLLTTPREMFRTPYVALAVIFSMGFIYAFSTIGNFGILVRQRVQVYPFVLVLLALHRPARTAPTGAERSRPAKVAT